MNANIEMSTPADKKELVPEQTAIDLCCERVGTRIRHPLRHGVMVLVSWSVILADKMELFRGLILTRIQSTFYNTNE